MAAPVTVTAADTLHVSCTYNPALHQLLPELGRLAPRLSPWAMAPRTRYAWPSWAGSPRRLPGTARGRRWTDHAGRKKPRPRQCAAVALGGGGGGVDFGAGAGLGAGPGAEVVGLALPEDAELPPVDADSDGSLWAGVVVVVGCALGDGAGLGGGAGLGSALAGSGLGSALAGSGLGAGLGSALAGLGAGWAPGAEVVVGVDLVPAPELELVLVPWP
jgi:hypothetical protein